MRKLSAACLLIPCRLHVLASFLEKSVKCAAECVQMFPLKPQQQEEEEEEKEVYAAALWGTGGCSEEKYWIVRTQVALARA